MSRARNRNDWLARARRQLTPTQQERRVAVFVACMLVIGLATQRYRAAHPPAAPIQQKPKYQTQTPRQAPSEDEPNE